MSRKNLEKNVSSYLSFFPKILLTTPVSQLFQVLAIWESSQVKFIPGQEFARSLPGAPSHVSENSKFTRGIGSYSKPFHWTGLQMCSSHNAFLGPASELLLAFCCFSRLNLLEIGFSLKRSLFWLRIQNMWNNQVR